MTSVNERIKHACKLLQTENKACKTEHSQQGVHVATQYAATPLLPPWAPKRLAPGTQAPSRRNVAVLSHAEYVSTLTAAAALRVRAALSDLDLLTSKVVSESRVTWAISVPILVFLGLSVLDLGPMYAKDRQTDRRQTTASFNASAY